MQRLDGCGVRRELGLRQRRCAASPKPGLPHPRPAALKAKIRCGGIPVGQRHPTSPSVTLELDRIYDKGVRRDLIMEISNGLPVAPSGTGSSGFLNLGEMLGMVGVVLAVPAAAPNNTICCAVAAVRC